MPEFWSLCYVARNFAYFTSIPVELQWGDDWNDAPYEHNAGEPYNDHRPTPGAARVEHSILKVAFDGDLSTPRDGFDYNSPYSVEDINNKKVPWLMSLEYYQPQESDEEHLAAWGGDSLDDFIKVVTKAGGNVYIPLGFKF